MIAKRLTEGEVTAFAKQAMAGITRPFPYAPQMVVVDERPLLLPQQIHPVFYGCFDWHSAVHSHWLLVRLLKLYGETAVSTPSRALLNQQFTADKLAQEAAYFEKRPSFERMYGWAWTLRLALELHEWDDADAQRWASHFQPLASNIVTLTHAYLPKLTWPIRCGFHPETSFALGQILDYAQGVGDESLANLVAAKGRAFYENDRDYPAAYEPSGQDFFSAGLNTADLMRRILPADQFSDWLGRFLPGLAAGQAGNLLQPVAASDLSDGGLVHLVGLNLSRAWTMQAIGTALPAADDPRKAVLAAAAAAHAAAGLPHVVGGDYMGDHWLASFAVYLLTEVGVTAAGAAR